MQWPSCKENSQECVGACSLQQSICLEAGFRPPPSQVYIYVNQLPHVNDASHVRFKISPRMRRLSDSARVRLAAKSALADKGDITVARVEDTARESS